jgi:hypothetical protein
VTKRGALVELMPAFGTVMPNIVVFQFNPETLRHSWTQPPATMQGTHPLAVQGMPGETFSFSLAMDVTDQAALGVNNPLGADALLNGIYSRLAALEMLMFPVPTGDPPTGGRRAVPAAQVPAVLFVWGDGRIVPVRVTSLTITEKLFDASLNPTHADAQIELRVLTPTEIEAISNNALKQIANAAYVYSQTKRVAGALFNINTAAGSIELPQILGT